VVKSKSFNPVIYIFINRINGKAYVGKTINENRRLGDHKSHRRYPIDLALQKYGISNFDYSILEHHDTEENLNEAECWWIAYLRSIGVQLYNITDGGDGASGHQHSEQTKQLLSQQKKDLYASGWKQPPRSEESKKKVSEKMKGHRRNVGKKHAPDCGHCKLLKERNQNNNPSKNRLSNQTKQKVNNP